MQATARGNAERAQQKLALQEEAARAERERADELRAEAERAERERRLAMAALARERAEVRKCLFCANCLNENDLIYQDRLGTNIGKALKRRCVFTGRGCGEASADRGGGCGCGCEESS
eukprot:COSAG06_NODE_3417_length_5373_cov_163.207622_2_plen_118_part_00